MKIFGVFCFVVGVLALAMLAVRRSSAVPVGTSDHMMMFIGLASAIAGLALFFVYAMPG